MPYNLERDFQDHFVRLLKPTRTSIVEYYQYMPNQSISCDVYSKFGKNEELRELKILIYASNPSSPKLGNLWAGLGKIAQMYQVKKMNNKNSWIIFLTLPEEDYNRVDNKIKTTIQNGVNHNNSILELANETTFYNA